MKQKALFNINRLVADSDAPVESSFLADLDYALRKYNERKPVYYFKKVTPMTHPEIFDTTKSSVNCAVVTELPVASKENEYESTKVVYLKSSGLDTEQEYFVCIYSDGKPSRTYKPSSMKCQRCMYYQVSGEELDKQLQKSGDFYGICESGEDRHLRIQSAVSKMKSVGTDCDFIKVSDYVREHNLPLKITGEKEFETKLYDEKRNISFLCDGVIKYKGQYYILEIKTETSYKWNQRKAIAEEHRNQAITYSMELGLKNIIFVYENRDICTKKSFLLTVTDADVDALEKKIAECTEYLAKKVIPPIDENIDKKICQYCDYRTACKRDSKCEK